MADGIEIKVDTRQAIAKLDRIPVQVRDNLRSVIPDLVRKLAGLVNIKLNTELKTRSSLNVAQELRESEKYILGVVRTESSKLPELPGYLEEGTRAHEITGSPLAFQWPNAPGGVAALFPNSFPTVFFRHVSHPGFKGIHYMARSLSEMEDEIRERITTAAKTGAGEAR
jgi:hypothetical protein